MYNKKELIEIRKIVVRRQITELQKQINLLKKVLERLDNGDTSKEVML